MSQFIACVCLLCAFGMGAMVVVVSRFGVLGAVVLFLAVVVVAAVVLSVIRYDRRKNGPM